MVVPPPMSTYTVVLTSSINMLAFGTRSKKHHILAQLSNKEFSLIRHGEDGRYDVVSVATEAKLSNLRHLLWLHSDVLAAVSDHENGNSLIFLKLSSVDGDKTELKVM